MKDTPLLFKAEMVRAILNGTKTQTRRVMKIQPDEDGVCKLLNVNRWEDTSGKNYTCPYGVVGSEIWVKETWRTWESLDHVKPSDLGNGELIEYAAGGNSIGAYKAHGMSKKWRSPLFMQKRFSRIQLEITGVRVERLNDISEADCVAEGVGAHRDMLLELFKRKDMSMKSAYCNLWESINGVGSWATNPWVWVIEFKRIG